MSRHAKLIYKRLSLYRIQFHAVFEAITGVFMLTQCMVANTYRNCRHYLLNRSTVSMREKSIFQMYLHE